MEEEDPEVRSLISTTWWPSLSMYSHSMPYCGQYPDIYHCSWDQGVTAGAKGVGHRRVCRTSLPSDVFPAKTVCHMCVQRCKRVEERVAEKGRGRQTGSEGTGGQRNRGRRGREKERGRARGKAGETGRKGSIAPDHLCLPILDLPSSPLTSPLHS